ncbi:hypothetical protein ACFU8Q_35155 [Streptomyces sp. NPDC057543]
MAAAVTATLAVALAVQHDTVLAVIFAVGSASFSSTRYAGSAGFIEQ